MSIVDIVIVALVAVAVALVLYKRFGSKGGGHCAGCSEAGTCAGATTGTCPVSSELVDKIDGAVKTTFEKADKGGGCCH